jgi:hypothetical protein
MESWPPWSDTRGAHAGGGGACPLGGLVVRPSEFCWELRLLLPRGMVEVDLVEVAVDLEVLELDALSWSSCRC